MQNKPMKELVELYNSLSPKKPAGPKTFSTRAKAIKAIEALQSRQTEVPKPPAESTPELKAKPKARSTRLIRTAAEDLILQDNPALSYEDILSKLKDEFPDCSTSIACLRWYATRLREMVDVGGQPVPARPRAIRKKDKTDEKA